MKDVVRQAVGFDRSRAVALMAREQLDGLLLTSPENVFYTTGFPATPVSGNPILYALRNRFPFFSFVDPNGKVTLLCWWFAAEGVRFAIDELRGIEDVESARKALVDLLRERLGPGTRLGVESVCPYYVVDVVQSVVGDGGLVDADRLLITLRLIKSEQERAFIQKSTEIVERTLVELYDMVHIGMSRLDLIQEAKYRLFRNGATGVGHVTFAFGQANPEIALPEVLEQQHLVTLDLGAAYNGYLSDIRRYMFSGEVPQGVQERHATMVAIVDEVGAALVPNTPFSVLWGLALDLYARHDLTARFPRIGHSIGLETEEMWISGDTGGIVEPGMAINIELYASTETGERVGNEETYFIDEAGPVRISSLDRSIVAVR